MLRQVALHYVEETHSEKLLGFMINKTMIRHNHIHGNEEHKGMLPKLSQRAGLVQKLSNVMPANRLRTITNGFSFSLLRHGIQNQGCVSVLDSYADSSGRYQTLTRDDSHQLQVVMNRVLRSVTKMDRETPIQLLLQTSGFLSFHQMCAHSILKTAHKVQLLEPSCQSLEKVSSTKQANSSARFLQT